MGFPQHRIGKSLSVDFPMKIWNCERRLGDFPSGLEFPLQICAQHKLSHLGGKRKAEASAKCYISPWLPVPYIASTSQDQSQFATAT